VPLLAPTWRRHWIFIVFRKYSNLIFLTFGLKLLNHAHVFVVLEVFDTLSTFCQRHPQKSRHWVNPHLEKICPPVLLQATTQKERKGKEIRSTQGHYSRLHFNNMGNRLRCTDFHKNSFIQILVSMFLRISDLQWVKFPLSHWLCWFFGS